MAQLQDGKDVRALQQKLKDLGLYKGNVDGIYGPRTAGAVKTYQKAKGLAVDGDAGKQTLGALAMPLNTKTNTAQNTPTTKPVSIPKKEVKATDSYSKKENIITHQGKRYTPYQFQQMVDTMEKSSMSNTFGADVSMLKLLNQGRAANNKQLYTGKRGSGYNNFTEAYAEANYPQLNKYSLGGTIEEQMDILELMGLKKKVDSTPTFMVGGRVSNYVTDPSDVLAKLQTNKAQAMAEGGSDFLGNAFGVLSQLVPAAMGAIGGENGEGWGLINESITGKPYINTIKPGATVEKMALGGEVSSNAEVEGEEVGITPDGQFLDFKGPNHEQGGMDVNLPEGTEMFSKRIKLEKEKGGKKVKKSIADWMKDEKEYDKKIAKKYDSDETDQLMKNTHKRATETTQGNIEKYKGVQKAFQQAQEELNQPMGLPEQMEGEQPQFALGGPVEPDTTLLNDGYEFDPLLLNLTKNAIQSDLNSNIPGTVNSGSQGGVGNTLNSSANTADTKKSSVLDLLKNAGSGLDFTLGDGLAIGGALKSAIDLKKNVLENRAGDTPNINPYLDYGQDALRTVEEMFNMQEVQKDDALHDAELSRNAAASRNNNSARSINTLNALNLASDQQFNNASGKIYANNAAALQKIMEAKADVQRDIDGNVMKGAADKDMNDRKDRDAFYQNMNEVIKNSGQTAETIGSYLNQVKQAKVSMNLVNELGRHGMRMTKNGTVEMIPGWNEKKGDVKTEEKKDGTIEVEKSAKNRASTLDTSEFSILQDDQKIKIAQGAGYTNVKLDAQGNVLGDTTDSNGKTKTEIVIPFTSVNDDMKSLFPFRKGKK